MNDVSVGVQTHTGGKSEFTALTTVVREIPNRSAIRVCGTPSPANLRISAHNPPKDHAPIIERSLLTAETVPFSSAADLRDYPGIVPIAAVRP